MGITLRNENKIDILLVKYRDHTEDLRHRMIFNLRMVFGFVTLSLLLTGWLSQYADKIGLPHQLGTTLLLLAVGATAIEALYHNHVRVKEIGETLGNINSALQFDKAKVYLPKCVNPPKAPSTKQIALGVRLLTIFVCVIAPLFVVWSKCLSDCYSFFVRFVR